MRAYLLVSLAAAIAGCNALLGQRPARATLTLDVPFVWVSQTGQATVPFTIARSGEGGALTVRATALPPGISAADAVVPDGLSTGTLTLTASASATLGKTASSVIELLHDSQLDDSQPLTVGASGPPGSLDTTWGAGGVVAWPSLGSPTAAQLVEVYAPSAGDDAAKVVTAGTLVSSNTDVRLVIARYAPDGTLDPTFGDPSGSTRLGYTVFNPGVSDNSALPTVPAGMGIDSQGRIAIANNRDDSLCYAEAGRWTRSGAVDSTFKRYSNQVNGTQYCGGATGLTIAPNDDVIMLAVWNILTGKETLLQTLAAADGSPTSTFHVSLDPSGTSQANQRMTEMFAVRMDARGGYVLAGRQYAGSNWANATNLSPVIARVAAGGQLDPTFGASAGFTSFSFGPGLNQLFWAEGIDPVTGDVVAVGENDVGTLGTLARVSDTTGLAVGFGQLTRDICPGSPSEALTQVMFDSRSRIVAVGSCSLAMTPLIANLRAGSDGALDPGYATAGIGTTPGTPLGAAIAADDRLYVVGVLGGNAAIWRYWP